MYTHSPPSSHSISEGDTVGPGDGLAGTEFQPAAELHPSLATLSHSAAGREVNRETDVLLYWWAGGLQLDSTAPIGGGGQSTQLLLENFIAILLLFRHS